MFNKLKSINKTVFAKFLEAIFLCLKYSMNKNVNTAGIANIKGAVIIIPGLELTIPSIKTAIRKNANNKFIRIKITEKKTDFSPVVCIRFCFKLVFVYWHFLMIDNRDYFLPAICIVLKIHYSAFFAIFLPVFATILFERI